MIQVQLFSANNAVAEKEKTILYQYVLDIREELWT